MKPAACKRALPVNGYYVLVRRDAHQRPASHLHLRWRRRVADANANGNTGWLQVTGSIDTGDPTQIDRLFRSGIPQTCPAGTTCAIFGDPNPRHYDSYTFTNTTGATQCVNDRYQHGCTGTNFIFIGSVSRQLRSEQHLHQLDRRFRVSARIRISRSRLTSTTGRRL